MKEINLVFVLVIGFALFVCASGVVSATIYVPDDYSKIQWAVDNASAGDTIIVSDGTYTENVDVDKRLTIRSENGSDNCIVQAANLYDPVLEITAGYVNISGFRVEMTLEEGIYLTADYCNISNNNCSNNWAGFYLNYSGNNIVSNNKCSNNSFGIILDHSNNSNISNNNCSNNSWGLELDRSNNNSISDNNFSFNNIDGINLYYSNDNNISKNNCFSNTRRGVRFYHSNGNHISKNNCFSNNYEGIRLMSSNGNSISKNNCSNNWHGIELYYSNNNTIENNTGKSNHYIGIWLLYSNTNIVTNNKLIECGIDLSGNSIEHFNSQIIEENTVNGKPVYYYKNVNGITVPENAGQIILANCSYMIIRSINASLVSDGIELAFTNNSVIEENICNSNNCIGIHLVYSVNNTIRNNNCTNNYLLGGIYLDSGCNNNIIENNNCNSNDEGIGFFSSNNNTVKNNNCSNNDHGIELYLSNNNTIITNNFINNTDNVYSSDSTNIWNSTSKMTYTYNGSEFENYLGNYWDDYTNVDSEGDGIWDNPYPIDSDRDYRPLVEPFENYPAPTENIFDTGAPANPYPSIFGTHNGTIKLNQTINVSKLYTYPCEGTGGHTEYARIWNNSGLDRIAKGGGYKEDWHNITFNKTFVLYKNETYNYTIRTGSYPQIIHGTPFNATGGTITCTEFTDANGKVYKDWIPAIKFFW